MMSAARKEGRPGKYLISVFLIASEWALLDGPWRLTRSMNDLRWVPFLFVLLANS